MVTPRALTDCCVIIADFIIKSYDVYYDQFTDSSNQAILLQEPVTQRYITPVTTHSGHIETAGYLSFPPYSHYGLVTAEVSVGCHTVDCFTYSGCLEIVLSQLMPDYTNNSSLKPSEVTTLDGQLSSTLQTDHVLLH